jgi:hypothetical protein
MQCTNIRIYQSGEAHYEPHSFHQKLIMTEAEFATLYHNQDMRLSLEPILCSLFKREGAHKRLSLCYWHWHSHVETWQLPRISIPTLSLAMGETSHSVTTVLECSAPLIHLCFDSTSSANCTLNLWRISVGYEPSFTKNLIADRRCNLLLTSMGAIIPNIFVTVAIYGYGQTEEVNTTVLME